MPVNCINGVFVIKIYGWSARTEKSGRNCEATARKAGLQESEERNRHGTAGRPQARTMQHNRIGPNMVQTQTGDTTEKMWRYKWFLEVSGELKVTKTLHLYPKTSIYLLWKASNLWPLSTAYAKKSIMFYLLVRSYFVTVFYMVTIAKITTLYAKQLTWLTPFLYLTGYVRYFIYCLSKRARVLWPKWRRKENPKISQHLALRGWVTPDVKSSHICKIIWNRNFQEKKCSKIWVYLTRGRKWCKFAKFIQCVGHPMQGWWWRVFRIFPILCV